jgi:hypothetical protein
MTRTQGPVLLGMCDPVYDDDVQEGQNEHNREGLYENLVEGDVNRFPLLSPLESRLNAAECAAMEIFSIPERYPAVATRHVETTLADTSGMAAEHGVYKEPIGDIIDQFPTPSLNAATTGDTFPDLMSVPLESVNEDFTGAICGRVIGFNHLPIPGWS